MNRYEPRELLRLAKRIGNRKRTYLLVNPLQGKHMPVEPGRALDMMSALGQLMAEKYPETRLVVGFAETATAIGAQVAACIGPRCRYIHTTREQINACQEWICFLEEHSHAAEQQLCREGYVRGAMDTPTILFVEDEISTGKTLRNMIRQLRETCPQAAKAKMVAASVINRLSAENKALMRAEGIVCESLVWLEDTDLSAAVEKFRVEAAEDVTQAAAGDFVCLKTGVQVPDPRMGVEAAAYISACHALADAVKEQLTPGLQQGMRVLVLGTEECMYPALTVGYALEEGLDCRVLCHATTRSPIGVLAEADYPISSGYRVQSFYDSERTTFLYDLATYDAAVIVTDAHTNCGKAAGCLAGLLHRYGECRVFLVGCSGDVQHV